MMQRMLGGCWCALFVAACSGGPGPYQTPPGEDPGTPTLSDDQPDYADDTPSYSDDLPGSAPPPKDPPGSDDGPEAPGDTSDCVQLCSLSDSLSCMEQNCVAQCEAVIDVPCGPQLVSLSRCGLSRLQRCDIDLDDDPNNPDATALAAQCSAEWGTFQACDGED